MSLELKTRLVESDVRESTFLEEWSVSDCPHYHLPILASVLFYWRCVCKYTCTRTCTFYSTCVDVRGQLEEVCSFHHVGSRDEVKWGLKSGGRAWKKSLLATELSCQPHPHYFIATELLYPDLLIVFCCYLPSEILFSFCIFNDFGLMILDR